MRITSLSPLALAKATLIAAAVLTACEDDVVYQDRPPFNPPPTAAASFLGYYDASTKKTTCGNCHTDLEAPWSATKHAQAYNTLNTNAGKQDSCFGCHTVNGRGNAAFGTTAGWDGVKDAVYHDVQCESCHGAGLQHVEGVGQGNLVRPLAKIGIDSSGNCADCHTGDHHPFDVEWGASRHANLNTSRASNPSCVGCHEARGALARWGVDANFVEKANPTAYQPPATCATCHDPHGSSNPSQLRYPISTADADQNLCMKCHNRRAEPEPPSTVTPHAPQGAMLLGYAGWRPPGFVYDTARIYGSHATTKNPKLCAGCHVVSFSVTDKLTGAFTFQATGHLFRPVPCLDAQGKPTADKTCAYTTAARTWQSCTQSGCHANADVAASAFNGVRSRMKNFTEQLWQDLNKDGTLQPAPTDGGLLARVKQQRPSEWTTADITPAEGAEFDARLCGEFGGTNSDNSKGVHNPFLCDALLTSTITYIKTYYALADVATSEQASQQTFMRILVARLPSSASRTGPARPGR
jgi:predicted CXXCH cytochrome family protein